MADALSSTRSWTIRMSGRSVSSGRPRWRSTSTLGRRPRGSGCNARVGAKNFVVVLPDADMTLATQIIADSAFGCAGQRCLAVSVAVAVGDAYSPFRSAIADAASSIRVGNGLDAGVQMGPVITPDSKQRIESLVAVGETEGARAMIDGRNARIAGFERGTFIKPTVLDGLPTTSSLAHTEIFGPVLSLMHAKSIDEAMDVSGSQSLREPGVAVYDERRGSQAVSI